MRRACMNGMGDKYIGSQDEEEDIEISIFMSNLFADKTC